MGQKALISIVLSTLVSIFFNPASSRADTLSGRTVILDSQGKILPWKGEDRTYDHVMRLAWERLKAMPVQANGAKTYITYPRFVGDENSSSPFMSGIPWTHNPAGLFAMLTDSGLSYYAYSGDPAILDLVREALDFHLEHGMTPSDWDWAHVPYASSDAGLTEFRGADDTKYCNPPKPCGRGDGIGIIEPDKVGELGYAFLRFYEVTGEEKYLSAALDAAQALAKHVRSGGYFWSPWPFRVNAKTDKSREQYTANMIGPVKLFDELIRLGYGDLESFKRARKKAWDWMMAYPMKNQNWSGYFEDIAIFWKPWKNVNQYTPLETVRYLLLHPELDADWKKHARDTIDWVVKIFAADSTTMAGLPEKGIQWGAEAISEQIDDMDKMSSHTARYASIQALWYEKTGDETAREKAFRSLNWASYFCRDNGVVKTSVDEETGYWFSDGYGDYMRHFLSTMASVPAWAPSDENHLLRSSSVIRAVDYTADEIHYVTFDGNATEVLRLKAAPSAVFSGETFLPKVSDLSGPGYVVEEMQNGGVVVRVRHESSKQHGEVTIVL